MKKMVQLSRIKKENMILDSAGPVLYWMHRDQRIQDNWALLYAQEKAVELQQPMMVIVIGDSDWYPRTIRHCSFMIEGLQGVEKGLKKLKIPFFVKVGQPLSLLKSFVKKYRVGVLVTDFNPLLYYQKNIQKISKFLDCAVYQVDAHNIVPCWVASEKQEYAARTIRPKIHKKLHEYLIEIPKVVVHPYVGKALASSIDWNDFEKKLKCDTAVAQLDWITPGEHAAHGVLKHFITHGLALYNTQRNDPTLEGQSNLSPYLHFGHISAQRIALQVSAVKCAKQARDTFLEELIVRKELSDNYCYYNKNYDALGGLSEWAQKTLQDHIRDTRHYVYTKKEFEQALTHDALWNAAQLELVHHGKMHGYMRMYWAKKILEWTKNPSHALKIAQELNDTYSLDGTDPNGYVGIAWAIGGLHDRPWFKRPIFGTIRYMSDKGCASKFDVQRYIKSVQ